MELLGGNADFGSQSEFTSVGEAGRGIEIDGRRIHFIEEFCRSRFVIRDDAFRVAGSVPGNKGDGFLFAFHGFHRQNIVAVFGIPVFCGCGDPPVV